MENRLEQSDLVRCSSCRVLYEPGQRATAEGEGDCCPACGGTSWLAERVPVDESSLGERA